MVGNKDSITAKEYGDMHISSNGQLIKIRRVLFAPDIALNLISILALARQMVRTTFMENLQMECVHVPTGTHILKARCNNEGLYELQVDGIETCAVSQIKEPSREPWHERLGHPGRQTLQQIAQSNKLQDIYYPDFCDVCARAKSIAHPFPDRPRESDTNVGDLIVTDLKGPFPVMARGGFRYYVTFIDGKTRFTTVYLLRHKSDTFKCFQQYEKLFERQTGKPIKKIRSDNGGEYTSREFSEYLKSNGYIHETTVPYTPQQNGIAERFNRTIMTKLRCLLISSGLPPHFWGELILTAVYLINRLPRHDGNSISPFELFFNKKPDKSNLRTIGCSAYALNTDPKRNALDQRGIQGILIGYQNTQKGWKIYIPSTDRIIVSRSVRFNEKEKGWRNAEPDQSDDTPNSTSIMEWLEDDHDMIIRSDQTDSQDNENIGLDPVDEDDIFEDAPHDLIPSPELINNLGPYWNPPVGPRRHSHTAIHIPFIQRALAAKIETDNVPSTYEEASRSDESQAWRVSELCEMQSLHDNNVFEWVARPKDKNVIKSKWVYDIKRRPDGSEIKKKARFVAKGFSQIQGHDYWDTFSPTAKATSLRILFAKAASEDMAIKQLDVSTAYLYAPIEEEIYIEPPKGHIPQAKNDMVWKLKKSLYGLKQSGRNWNRTMDTFFQENGFKRSQADYSVYTKEYDGNNLVIIALYVDDNLILAHREKDLVETKSLLEGRLKMKEIDTNCFVGVEYDQNTQDGTISIHQKGYINRIINTFKEFIPVKAYNTPMASPVLLTKTQCPTTDDEKSEMSKFPYARVLGSLMFIMIYSRPDLSHAIGILSRFMSNPDPEHWEALKRVLGYLNATRGFRITYRKSSDKGITIFILKEFSFAVSNDKVYGFSDSDHAACRDTRKSVTGYTFIWSKAAISWSSKRQATVSTSSCEAEYIALAETGREALWIQSFMRSVKIPIGIIQIYGDNDGAMASAKDPMFHSRMKHIDVKWHVIREWVDKGLISIKRVSTNYMVADSLTKSVSKEKTIFCRESMGCSD